MTSDALYVLQRWVPGEGWRPDRLATFRLRRSARAELKWRRENYPAVRWRARKYIPDQRARV